MLRHEDIIFRDEVLVVINKPAGLLVHPSWIDKDETQTAMKLLRDLIGQWVYPVHRLDKPTSGILVFALSSEIAKALTAAFTERSVSKEYIAVVRGHTCEAETIDYPLRELWDKMTDRESSRDKPAQPAITCYERLAIAELPIAVRPHLSARYSLLRVRPQTGRSRQIRRHLKHIFHQIIGDHKHGDNAHNRMFAEHLDCHRLLLHASMISFAHPVSGEQMSLHAPLPDDFMAILQRVFGITDFC
ncbi:MAG: pseudouridylate synthase [Candidatus Riflebacteria bacterium]|nr:pseudouridylate synthase [Candidatus Riflebacteria bacterium]